MLSYSLGEIEKRIKDSGCTVFELYKYNDKSQSLHTDTLTFLGEDFISGENGVEYVMIKLVKFLFTHKEFNDAYNINDITVMDIVCDMFELDEDEYNSTINANSSLTFTDCYNKTDKVFVMVIDNV